MDENQLQIQIEQFRLRMDILEKQQELLIWTPSNSEAAAASQEWRDNRTKLLNGIRDDITSLKRKYDEVKQTTGLY